MNLPQDVTSMLRALVRGMREALGDDLVGVYLRGSLAIGDFDPDTSDIDFLAVTERPITDPKFTALAVLHARLAQLANRYANQLEGPYLDRLAARRFRPGERHPTIARDEALAWREHGSNWVLERWVVRERGVALLGPDPKSLIDPVSPDEVRAAVRARLPDWVAWANQPNDPDWRLPRGHKAYVVETMCRALYTLACGALPSKPQAVAWALATLPEPWRSTVERSRSWRTVEADEPPDQAIVAEARQFVLWTAAEGEGT